MSGGQVLLPPGIRDKAALTFQARGVRNRLNQEVVVMTVNMLLEISVSGREVCNARPAPRPQENGDQREAMLSGYVFPSPFWSPLLHWLPQPVTAASQGMDFPADS